MLITTKEDLNHGTQIDKYISAEIPKVSENKALHQAVSDFMIHKCSDEFCKNNEFKQCIRNFPKEYENSTVVEIDQYPIYRRRQTGATCVKRNKLYDSRHVVPYNPFLLLKYQCHMNVECVSNLQVIKYLYKYIYKGEDMLKISLESDTYCEIEEYVVNRYISAPEAHWKINGFKISYESTSTLFLPVHLPLKQSVLFSIYDTEEMLKRKLLKQTKLEAYFVLNHYDENARKYKFSEIPFYYKFDKQSCFWEKRKRDNFQVGSLQYISPNKDEETFYLRLLLLERKGCTSFEDLRTIKDIQYESFKQAAIALGITTSSTYYKSCFVEAASFFTSTHQLREYFIFILRNFQIENQYAFLEECKTYLMEDISRDYPNHTEEHKNLLLLSLLNLSLKSQDLTFKDVGLDELIKKYDFSVSNNFQIDEPEIFDITTLNEEQKFIYDSIILNNGVYMIDAPGGSGKTYLLKAIISNFKSEEVIAVASTGIAALNLPNGSTAHSRFKIPIPCHEGAICNITKKQFIGKNIDKIKLIVWDEISQVSKYILDSVSRTLMYLKENDLPFGGITTVLSGDFRQILPIVKFANEAKVIDQCCKFSNVWKNITTFKMKKNMRTQNLEWKKFLLDVGNDKIDKDENNYIELPSSVQICNSIESLVQSVYQNDLLYNYKNKAILCPTNKMCKEINDYCLNILPGKKITFKSYDEILNKTNLTEEIPTEFINKMKLDGMPPHELNLKQGCIVMLVRNLSSSQGLFNGTQIQITKFLSKQIEGIIVSEGKFYMRTVLIPKIKLNCNPSKSPLKISRTQYPFKLSYAMTINKSQCKTLERVGLYLTEENQCFTHGHLYVALSRIKGDSSSICVFKSRKVKNIVYRSILYRD